MSKVFYYPFNEESNEYSSKVKAILSTSHSVDGLPLPRDVIRNFTSSKFSDSTAILNWYEDRGSDGSWAKFFLYSFHLLFLKVKFKNVIWIKHNLKPHSHSNFFRFKLLSILLDIISDSKVTHRPIDGFLYIPHPTYTAKNISGKNKIENICFGQIKPYKGILELLEKWDRSEFLYIVGKCNDELLEKDILDKISMLDLNVKFENRFVERDELDALISSSENVILPHKDGSMIVSGAFFHAASMGAKVKVCDGEFLDYLKQNFTFVSGIDEEKKVIATRSQVISELNKVCADRILIDAFNDLIH